MSNLGKFIPEPPHVFRNLGSDLGTLPDEAHTALAAFYFRVFMVNADIERMTKSPCDAYLSEEQIIHFAATLWAACDPAANALETLRRLVRDPGELDKGLEKAAKYIQFPTPISRQLREIAGLPRPRIDGVADHLS